MTIKDVKGHKRTSKDTRDKRGVESTEKRSFKKCVLLTRRYTQCSFNLCCTTIWCATM